MIRWFIHHTVASQANDHSPTLLQKTAILGMAVLVTLSFVMSSAHSLLWPYSSWLTGTVLPAVVASLTNDERHSYQAPALSRNTLLDEAARMKAEHMAAEGYFAHYSPGGISPWFWFERVGYQYAHAGENLAVHFSDSAAVVDAWMKSPTHKANIVNAVYTEIGIGVARGRHDGFDTLFVVQLFGTPALSPVGRPTLSLDTLPDRPFLATADVPPPVVTVAEDALVAGADDQGDKLPLPPSPVKVTTADDTILTPSSPAVPAVEASPVEETGAVMVESYGHAESVAIQSVPLEQLAMVEESQFSSLSTSSGLAPSLLKDELLSAGTSAPMVARLATQPNTWLRYVYLVVGTVVIFSLLASVVISWRRHQPLQIAYGVGLLVVMMGCYYLHTAVTSSVVII